MRLFFNNKIIKIQDFTPHLNTVYAVQLYLLYCHCFEKTAVTVLIGCFAVTSSSSAKTTTRRAPGRTTTSATTLTTSGTRDEQWRLVNRLKHANPARFEELIKVHLSHVLDLPGTSLEEFLHAEEQKRSRTARLLSKSKKRLGWEQQTAKCKDGGVFGQELCMDGMQPIITIIHHLKQAKYLSEEGLFRKSGNERRKRTLIASINSGDICEELTTASYSGHDLAEVIKLYVKELPEPLLTHRYNTAYSQVQGFDCDQKKVRAIQLLLQLLPKDNYILLQSILMLLHAVAAHARTRMTSETLGLLLAPHVLASRPTDAEQLRDQVTSGEHAALMGLLIKYSDSVFQLPEVFHRDVKSYWDLMEKTDDTIDFAGSACLMRCDPADEAIKSCVTFTDRKASEVNDDYTQMQLASLCAHIGAMPDGAKKRRYAKKVTASNATPSSTAMSAKHTRSKSFGESLKKFVGRSQPRRRYLNSSNHSDTTTTTRSSSTHSDSTFSPVQDYSSAGRWRGVSASTHTPRQKLFINGLHKKVMNTPRSRRPILMDQSNQARKPAKC